MLEGGNIILLGSGSGASGLKYLWTPSTALNSNTIANPKASPVTDITYTLKVTSSEGCADTDIVFVKVLLAPVIPNAFSPNGDGINDKWEITSLESYPGCTVDVYNRYGQVIFRSVGYTKPWDGTYQSKPVPAGTYYYIVNPKNGRQQIAGFVDVLR
jgi:gliding motility-associated-like protein